MSADLLTRLIEAGTPAALVAEVAMALGRAAGEKEALEQRRANDRERQHRRRHATSRDITLDHASSRDVTDTPPPSPSPSLPPDPQPNPAPTRPRVGTALTRKAAGFGPPEAVTLERWNEFCGQRKKALTRTAYDAIVTKLVEAAQLGWPPGDVVGRAIESGWETIFIPKDRQHGQRPHHHRPTGNGLLDACLDGERAGRA